MPKRNTTTTTSASASASASIASVRDGGRRAAKIGRELRQYGADMLALWPELASNYADGDARWANFDAGVVEHFDETNPGVLIVRGDDGWRVVPEGYVKGDAMDLLVTGAWCKARSRKAWADMKKDEPTMYAIATPVRDATSRAMVEARRVLKDAVRKALTGAGRKSKGANRAPAEVVADTLKGLQDQIKSWESRELITKDQAKKWREVLASIKLA
jgi:hypothetical protein